MMFDDQKENNERISKKGPRNTQKKQIGNDSIPAMETKSDSQTCSGVMRMASNTTRRKKSSEN